MQSSFLFGRTVNADKFTNRNIEMQRLKDNFTNEVNTLLIAPRRWGKSSLVKKVALSLHGRHTKTVMIDMMGIRKE